MKLLKYFILLIAFSSFGDLIDFEQGFYDQQQINYVVTETNKVTFGVGQTSPTAPTYIAEAGGISTAFITPLNPSIQDDAPYGINSQFSLTGTDSNNYFISFETGVTELSLDLYDFRSPEGSTRPGDFATLTLYSDLYKTEIVQDFFYVDDNLPDGNVAHLTVISDIIGLSASLTFSSRDGGKAIDNISFKTVPEPDTWVLFVFSLLFILLIACNRKMLVKRSK